MIIDLTHTITPDLAAYPGDQAPALVPSATLPKNGFRTTLLTMTSHTGTHLDAPSHILRDGSDLDDLPISQFSGRAAALDVSQVGPVITAGYLREQNGLIQTADFVLFYTGWEKKWGTPAFFEDGFPVLDEAAARYLVSCGLKGVGTDSFSVDALSNAEMPAHRILLSDGMVIVECLCVKKVVGRRDFHFTALPLKYKNADGAPVRAIAELGEQQAEKEM